MKPKLTPSIRTMLCTLLAVAFSLAVSPAGAEVVTKKVAYKDGDVELQGFFAWDDSVQGKRPGVLVVHEWWGLDDYARSRAKQLAGMGYVAFALDMYGEGKVTEHPEEAGKWAGMIRKNQKAWQQRAVAGLKVLKGNDLVDGSKLAAIGYCFGGSTVLQLAYTGADLKAAVVFHGALPVATSEQAKRIKSRILVCHGSEDPLIEGETTLKFQTALNEADVDYEFIAYGNTRHSFTNPGADKRNIPALKYNKQSDERSWRQMKQTFADAFGK